jgi:Uma2 family endonuclease
MSAAPQQVWTPESYLAFERESETKHEYLAGEIFAMTGASENHNLVTANTLASLHAQLRRTPCRIYPSDMRLKVPAVGLYTYPDVTVVCGEPQFDEDEVPDTLLNPTVLIEVLSPSTESYDRGKKFQHYRTLESLQEYLLISQESARIEHYVRQGEQWLFSDAYRLEDVVKLPSIDCSLALADVYEKVTFEPEADQGAST